MTLWRPSTPLVLASASRIRRQLLQNAGIPVEVCPAEIDERAVEAVAAPGTSAEIAMVLARAKGASVARKMPERLILAADQTMSCDRRVYHKPASPEAAEEQIMSLQGRTHELHAALALYDQGDLCFEHCSTARLTMRPASSGFVRQYLAMGGEGVSSSVGGYQLEGIGIHLFERIEGDYFTILGLPMLPLLHFFQQRQYVVS